MPPALLISAALAAAYAVIGWASLLLAVPPGYAIPIYLPAGLALAAMMTYGHRVWPGVFLGALAVQIAAGINSGFGGIHWVSYIILSAGCTLQAMVGTWLARRLMGLPNPLDRQESIFRFLAIVTPVSCLTAASIAIPTLVLTGAIAKEEALFNWWGWWVGDTIGVLVAVPLFMVYFGLPAEDWRPRRLAVAIPLLVASMLSVLAYMQVSAWDEARIEYRFQQEAEHRATLIRTRLETQLDMLMAVERWLDNTPNADATGFHHYVTPWLNRYPGTQNFGWSPLVTQAQKNSFEAALRRTHADFRIQDRDAGGTLFPAREAPQYLPLSFIEPLDKNWRALGLNILSLPSTAIAVHRAWQSGQAEATEPFRLVQELAEQKGVAIYQPLYREANIGRGDKPDRQALRGMLSGVLRMDDIMNAILDHHQIKGLELCLVDTMAPAENRLLYGSRQCEQALWQATAYKHIMPLDFAGRRWEIRQRATPEYVAPLRSLAAWATIAVGLGAVSLLGAFLLVSSGSSRRVSRLVEQRTAQLGKATRLLEEQQAALKDAQRIARLGSWEWEPGEALMRCSAEMHQLLAGTLPKLALRDFPGLFTPEDRSMVDQAIKAVLKSADSETLDAHPRHPVAGVDILHLQIESTWQEGKLVRVRGTLQDVTALRTAEAHIHYLAHFDILTGLPNRSQWLSRARSALAAAERHDEKLAVLFLDLDRFKHVNDSLGHPIGDRLLSAVAERLSTCLREEDFLARLGGDEFVVLLERINTADDAGTVARKMLDVMSAPIQVDQHELRPTVSIGIALYPRDGQDIDSLLQQADVAMYSAKAQGRNNFQYFIPDMTTRASEHLTIEAALRRALERHEFILHYQPQIEPLTGRVSGAEALIRWQHPERGLLLPGSFITVAEETGMIVPIGAWVMGEAFKQQQRWLKDGLPPIRLAANISALQFLKPDFIATVEKALDASGADPRLLELELTESTLMEPDEALINRLTVLRQMGFTLALDDFGTGYSSLSYLKRLPISRLKVDRSFVRDLPGDPEDTAIAMATLSLARDLGLEVVAEGVETLDQMEFLLGRNCHNMQGYYFSKPLPVKEFEQYLRHHGGLETWIGGHNLSHFPDL